MRTLRKAGDYKMSTESNTNMLRSRAKLTDTIVDSVCEVLDRNVHCTEDVETRYKKRFKEVYERFIAENMTVVDSSTEDPEFDPDVASEMELNDKLIPQVNEQICLVAEKRKDCPFLCVKQMADECKHVHKDMKRRRTKVPSSLTPVPERNTSVTDRDVPLKFKQTCSTMASLSLVGPKVLDAASNLSETLNRRSTGYSTTTDALLFRAGKKITTSSASHSEIPQRQVSLGIGNINRPMLCVASPGGRCKKVI